MKKDANSILIYKGITAYFARISTAFLVGVLLLGLAACQSHPTYQAYPGPVKPADEVASVFIPREFNLLNVDGESYIQPLVGNGTFVKFLPGSHKIVIKYVDFWEPNVEITERVASQPMLLVFDVKAGGSYLIQSREIKDIKAAKEFASNPEVDIIDKQSQTTVATDIKYKMEDKGMIAAFLGSLSSNDSPDPSPENAATTEENGQEPALEMLKYWWQKSDTEQQEDFMKWVAEKEDTASTTIENTDNESPLEMLEHWWQKANAKQQEDFMKWVVEK